VNDVPRPVGPSEPSRPLDPEVPEIWDLNTWDPVATWAAKDGQPMMLFWRFEKEA
jgi:hypothetical protein